MKILVLADKEEAGLWDYYTPKKTEGIDLIISCGDLDPDYLEFLTTVVNRPLLYVRGNHDGRYDRKEPLGCIDIDDRIYEYRGLRIMGLGGSYRYHPGKDMYTEREMRERIRKMKRILYLSEGIDILVTHAPAMGYGDMDDLPHRGFECFCELMETYHPLYMFHGHVHQEYGNFRRLIQHPCGTKIINACGHMVVEIDPVTDNAERNMRKLLYRWYTNRLNKG